MMREKTECCIGMDILKFLCAFLSICIRRPFDRTAGASFAALTCIAVPIFS